MIAPNQAQTLNHHAIKIFGFIKKFYSTFVEKKKDSLVYHVHVLDTVETFTWRPQDVTWHTMLEDD